MVLWIQSSLRKRGRKGNQNLHSKKRGKICYLFSIYKWNNINQNKTIKQYIKIIIYSFCLPESFNTNISHKLSDHKKKPLWVHKTHKKFKELFYVQIPGFKR